MYLLWKQGLVSLEAPDDFKSFKFVIDAAAAELDRFSKTLVGIATFDGPTISWIAQSPLRAMGECAKDPAWQIAFDAMLDKARPHGWVDPRTGAIKAHVEWLRAN
jgi:hypothetical protein